MAHTLSHMRANPAKANQARHKMCIKYVTKVKPSRARKRTRPAKTKANSEKECCSPSAALGLLGLLGTRGFCFFRGGPFWSSSSSSSAVAVYFVVWEEVDPMHERSKNNKQRISYRVAQRRSAAGTCGGLLHRKGTVGWGRCLGPRDMVYLSIVVHCVRLKQAVNQWCWKN